MQIKKRAKTQKHRSGFTGHPSNPYEMWMQILNIILDREGTRKVVGGCDEETTLLSLCQGLGHGDSAILRR